MCGLCGFYILDGRNTASTKRCVRQFVSMDTRGGDAVGWIGSYQNALQDAVKYDGHVCPIIKKCLKESVIGCGCLVGHTRLATHGESEYNNNHPHEYDNDKVFGAVTHNGVIHNHEDTAKRCGLELVGECDSELLARLIESYDTDMALVDRVADAINECNDNSHIAVAVVEDDGEGIQLVLASRGNPVCYSVNRGIMYYASTKDSLGKDALSLNEGSMLTVHNGEIEIVHDMLNTLSQPWSMSNWYNHRPVRPYRMDTQCGIRRGSKWDTFDEAYLNKSKKKGGKKS